MEVFIYLSVILTRGKYNPYMTRNLRIYSPQQGSRGEAIINNYRRVLGRGRDKAFMANRTSTPRSQYQSRRNTSYSYIFA